MFRVIIVNLFTLNSIVMCIKLEELKYHYLFRLNTLKEDNKSTQIFVDD